MKKVPATTILMPFFLVLFLISIGYCTTIFDYDAGISNSATIYNIRKSDHSSLRNGTITVTGIIVKVSGNALAKFVGTCSVTIDPFNIIRKDTRRNYTKIFIPSDTLSDFERSLGKRVIFQGEVNSANLARKERIDGELFSYIEFKNVNIWLEK